MIRANIICDSISSVTGDRITTFEIEVPRIVWSEFMTHRMFSRNAASSRAIPFVKMLEQLKGKPVRFGAKSAGMQDNGEHDALVQGRISFSAQDGDYYEMLDPEDAWNAAKEDAVFWSKAFAAAGYAKQIFNRLTEPFQIIKGVVTATEWANFFWLRNHEAADPTLQELARLMWEAKEDSKPQELAPGQWHLPYVESVIEKRVDSAFDVPSKYDTTYYVQRFYLDESRTVEIELEDAIKVSCARCASVSFRNTDYDVEKSKQVYERLIGDERKHASAFEHCATPLPLLMPVYMEIAPEDMDIIAPSKWPEGVTNVDRKGCAWSGNFRGFLQYRKTIPGENYEGQAKA